MYFSHKIGQDNAAQIVKLKEDIKSLTLSQNCYRNLFKCSIPVAVNVPDESTSALKMINKKLEVEFDNKENGSGIAFQFTPRLNLEDYYLELNGTSTNNFQFIVELKIRTGRKLNVTIQAPYSYKKQRLTILRV